MEAKDIQFHGQMFVGHLRRELRANKDRMLALIESGRRNAFEALKRYESFGQVPSSGVFQSTAIEADQLCKVVDKLQAILNQAEMLLPVEFLRDDEHDAVGCEACGLPIVLLKTEHHHEGGENAQCVHVCDHCEAERGRQRAQQRYAAKRKAEQEIKRLVRRLETLRHRAMVTKDMETENEANCLAKQIGEKRVELLETFKDLEQ